VQAAHDSIVEMLTYQPDTADQKLNAARSRLTGPFLESYNQLIQTVVIPSAKQKKITAAAKVPAAAAVSAGDDRAIVLAYVDQTLALGTAPPTRTNSTVRVTMEHVDGVWLISGFDPI
jgi:Mce-associated membrane protein